MITLYLYISTSSKLDGWLSILPVVPLDDLKELRGRCREWCWYIESGWIGQFWSYLVAPLTKIGVDITDNIYVST